MDIHEYQAKEILGRFGVPVPRGGLAYSPEQASYRATEIGGAAWVAKAQVHSGGRGEAGGVRLCRSDHEVADVANSLFGRRLVTRQSGPAGKVVFRVYVEEANDIARERHASDRGLSYVGLDGDIGCMINGAGLAMATMDMIELAGGEPANFLDIGGGASPERVLKAFRAVLQDRNVKAMLVNIFAGINRCGWVAEGIVSAFKEIDVMIPVVVRLAGTHVEQGQQLLRDSGLPIVTADTLAEAARQAVAALCPPTSATAAGSVASAADPTS